MSLNRIRPIYWVILITASLLPAQAAAATPMPPCIIGSPCDSQPGPYDLSRFDIPFAYSWPTDPVTTQTIEVVPGSISSLRSAVATNAARVIVPAGTYSGGLSDWGDDVDIVMDNGATVNGPITIIDRNRIRWTGGNIETTSDVTFRNTDDVLLDNVNIRAFGIYPGAGQSGSRIAFVRVTARCDHYCFFSQGATFSERFKYEDFIIADCDLEGGYPSGDEATIRWQHVHRGIFVDSRSWNGAKHTFRTHAGSANIYINNVQLENGNMIMTQAEPGGGPLTDSLNILGAIYIYNSRLYKPDIGTNVLRHYPTEQYDDVFVQVDNTAYNAGQTDPAGELNRRFASPAQPGDITSNNYEYPYEAPPPFTGGADH